MIGNIYKHKTSGACFRIKSLALTIEGEKFVELFECALTAKTYKASSIFFILDKEWFVSAENTAFEKLFDKETSPKKELSDILEKCYLENKSVAVEQWAVFDAILYAGMFEYKAKIEVNAQEVRNHFNPPHGNKTNT